MPHIPGSCTYGHGEMHIWKPHGKVLADLPVPSHGACIVLVGDTRSTLAEEASGLGR